MKLAGEAFIRLVFALALIALVVRSDRLSNEVRFTREWVLTIQQGLMVAIVSDPCQKCGNTVYNSLQMPVNAVYDGRLPRAFCAKCGLPDAGWMRNHAEKQKKER